MVYRKDNFRFGSFDKAQKMNKRNGQIRPFSPLRASCAGLHLIQAKAFHENTYKKLSFQKSARSWFIIA